LEILTGKLELAHRKYEPNHDLVTTYQTVIMIPSRILLALSAVIGVFAVDDAAKAPKAPASRSSTLLT